MIFVLDASVALGWTLDNPVPPAATRAKLALLSGTKAMVPALWHLQVANGLAVAERRGILTSSDATMALLQLQQLCAQALEIQADIVPMRQALTTARTYHLSAYDSVYLDLALRLAWNCCADTLPMFLCFAKASLAQNLCFCSVQDSSPPRLCLYRKH